MSEKYKIFKNEDITQTEADKIIKGNKYVLELYDNGFAFYIDGMWIVDASDMISRNMMIVANSNNTNKQRTHVMEQIESPDDPLCQGCKEGRTYYKVRNRSMAGSRIVVKI